MLRSWVPGEKARAEGVAQLASLAEPWGGAVGGGREERGGPEKEDVRGVGGVEAVCWMRGGRVQLVRVEAEDGHSPDTLELEQLAHTNRAYSPSARVAAHIGNIEE